jgi:hypothetical protein
VVHLENDLWSVYASQDLTILGIDLMEPPPLVESWVALKGLTYPIAIDPDAALYLLFTTSPIPYNLLIGRDGTLRFGSYGFDLIAMRNMIEELLAEDPAPTAKSSWSALKALY